MSYISEITAPVVRVLTNACDGPPHLFAGYAANAEFWAGEACHCMDVIRGYARRFERLHTATNDYCYVWGHVLDRPITRSVGESEVGSLLQEVRNVSRRFLKRCQKMNMMTSDDLLRYVRNLQLELPL